MPRNALRIVLRARYLLLCGWAAPWAHHWFVRSQMRGLTDWLIFEFGGRALTHSRQHYSGGMWSLYADHPDVQIGPPALWSVGIFQWLDPHTVAVLFCGLMVLAGLVCLRASEVVAVRVSGLPADQVAQTSLLAGLVFVPVWAAEVSVSRHLDDVIAISGCLCAAAVIARRGAWWWVGLLLGTAISAKPWAIAAAPLILGLSRPQRAPATLATLATGAVWWGPFALGDPRTFRELSSFHLFIDGQSTLRALGLEGLSPSWVRPVQLAGGVLLCVLVARLRGWIRIPLAAFALRVAIDPQSWPYYGLAPLAGALLLDAVSQHRLPWGTFLTWSALFVWPAVGDPGSVPWVRLAWAVTTIGAILVRRTGIGDPAAGTSSHTEFTEVG